MNYNHLTINERITIYELLNKGYKPLSVAKAINRSKSTVTREIKRNGFNGKYFPVEAQTQYEERREVCHRSSMITPELVNHIEIRIKQTWSPEQISGYGDDILKMPSMATIYRWIHQGLISKVTMHDLRRKGTYRRPKEGRGCIKGKGIGQRPKEAYDKTIAGHYEIDTIESGRLDRQRKSTTCILTIVERSSKYLFAGKMENRKTELTSATTVKLLRRENVKTITGDRGKEFASHSIVEQKLKCGFYLADPYCAWQRGINENTNGLLREFFPKGMDLANITNKELNEKVALLNNRPRKILGFKTPSQVRNEQITKLVHLN